jgi:hypothetical protein
MTPLPCVAICGVSFATVNSVPPEGVNPTIKFPTDDETVPIKFASCRCKTGYTGLVCPGTIAPPRYSTPGSRP